MNGPQSRPRPSGPPNGRDTRGGRTGPRGQGISDRFGFLLVLLLGLFIAQGLGDAVWARVLVGSLQLGALVVAFYSTGVLVARPWLVLLGSGGLVAFGLAAARAAGGPLYAAASIVGVGVILSMLLSVLLRVLRHEKVTIQTLFGAVCAYLLIGFLFANIYGAFDGLGTRPLFGEPVPRAVYSYFSFVTLTTVGFGDYTARGELARRFVDLEAVLGQVFIATTLARLVALYRGPAANRPDRPAGPPGAGDSPG